MPRLALIFLFLIRFPSGLCSHTSVCLQFHFPCIIFFPIAQFPRSECFVRCMISCCFYSCYCDSLSFFRSVYNNISDFQQCYCCKTDCVANIMMFVKNQQANRKKCGIKMRTFFLSIVQSKSNCTSQFSNEIGANKQTENNVRYLSGSNNFR